MIITVIQEESRLIQRRESISAAGFVYFLKEMRKPYLKDCKLDEQLIANYVRSLVYRRVFSKIFHCKKRV